MLIKNQLTELELKEILKERKYYENYKSISIEALKVVQRSRGWISDQLIKEIAKVLHITVSELEEVATFYSQIYRQPVGRNIIRYCDSVVCDMLGCNKIKNTIQDALGIKIGQTTLDNKFTLLNISCLGNCDKAPVIMINDDTYVHVEVSDLVNLLEKYL